MCGIIGYVGNPDRTIDVLLEGLSRLEYRGYDSSGVALMDDGCFKVYKSAGKLENLKKKLSGYSLIGNLGIGHTRWLTHGEATEKNAHPHTSGKISVVHNGIVENFIDLKKKLKMKGYKFRSDTDTEIIAHLIEDFSNNGLELEDAVREALREVEGSCALVVISERDPDKIVAAKQFSPLVVAVGEHENYVASDISAILSFCRNVIFLEDGEIAVLERESVRIVDFEGKTLERDAQTISWDNVSVEKCGYPHFMIKEIYEQPQAVFDTMRGRFSEKTGEIFFEELNSSYLKDISKIEILACGTSYYASLIGKHMIEAIASIPVQVDIASEFRYRNPLINDKTLAIIVSQSGETADTLEALFEARRCGAKILGITNVFMSKIARESDDVIYTRSGLEIGVASTKAFTTQLVAFFLFSVYLGRIKKQISKENAIELIREAIRIPQLIQATLKLDENIKELAEEFSHYNNFLYLGRGINYPIALEGALKLKEVSYIHAEGCAAGEMKHGPIALIDENMPVILIAPNDGVTYRKILGNLHEIKARKGKVIFLTSSAGVSELKGSADQIIEIPASHCLLSPIISVIPLQLLAYHIGMLRGIDVDQPRNLAKVVTVE